MVKNKRNTEYNVLIFIILILSVSISIICIQIIYRDQLNKYDLSLIEKNSKKHMNKKTIYDTSKLKFINVSLMETISELKNTCVNSCNLDIKDYYRDYKLIIEKKDDGIYNLDVVSNNKAVIRNKNLGFNVEHLYIMLYFGNLVLFNQIENETYVYDYALMLDADGKIDEISSVEANEMQFTRDGIIYYYEECKNKNSKDATKIKAIRYPYKEIAEFIDSQDKEYDWCLKSEE